MLVLELLGTLSLRGDTGPAPPGVQQKRRLGLLALLSLGGRQGLPRDRIEAYLWPESSAERARHALDQAVYAIRHAVGSDVILSTGRELRLNPELVTADVWEFDAAVRAREWAAAVGHYKGLLLDGFHFSESRELESWIDAERARLRREYETALEFLANRSAEAGDHSQSVAWWRRLVSSDPLSPAATKKLMLALAAAGDRAGAVKHARLYQEVVRQQLEIEPDAEIERLAASLSRQAITDSAGPATLESDTPSSIVSSAVEAQTGKADSRPDRRMLYPLLAVAIVMTGAAIWGWKRPAASKPVVRYTLVVDSTEAISRCCSWSGRMALSPDGSRLAYIGGRRSQLLLRPRDQLRATAVSGTEGASTPFFSPDGRQVGFLFEKKVQIVSVDVRASPITVTDRLTGITGASWGPDGFIYADGSGRTGLLRVEATSGAVPEWFTALDTASGEVDHTWPDVLPNGKGVLFTDTFSGKNAAKDTTTFAIAIADIPSGKHRVLVNDATHARYAVSGHLVYVTTNRTLMVVPFDQNSMKVTGMPAALIEGMRLGSFGAADLAVSEAGTLVYAAGGGEGKQELVWVTRDGKAQVVDPDWQGGLFAGPALSPDGKRLAVMRSPNVSASSDIWIKELDQGPSIKLTFEGRENYAPAWTPDGRSVTFCSNAAGSF